MVNFLLLPIIKYTLEKKKKTTLKSRFYNPNSHTLVRIFIVTIVYLILNYTMK